MPDDVIFNKAAIIDRCLQRIDEEYADNHANLENYTKQDSIILNIQRACEACIDLAMHLVAVKALGIPQTSRDAFDLLAANSFIDHQLATKLKAMVGFRNIAVHNYQVLDLGVIQGIIENNLQDILDFGRLMLGSREQISSL